MYRRIWAKMIWGILAGVLLLSLPMETTAYRRVSVRAPRRYSAVIARLPLGHSKIVVGGTLYYHYRGVFYRKAHRGYKVVRAPRGARVKLLPSGHATVYIGAEPYFYYYGAYYRYAPDAEVYVVVEPPHDVEHVEATTFDTIGLIDGSTLEGTYMGGTRSIVQFVVGEEIREIPVEEIVSIRFVPPSPSVEEASVE